MKRGWHDPAANVDFLKKRLKEAGLEGKSIETYFDYIDFDEGRDPISAKAWEAVF
jgi:gluconokinase